MNLFNLQGTLDARLGFTTPSTGIVKTRFLNYLNQTHQEILSKKGLSKLRRVVLSFPCTANTPFAVLPLAATRVFAITDRVNNWELVQVPLAEIRQGDPGLSMSSSFPDRYAVYNIATPMVNELAVASQLYVDSSNASDDNTKTAYIEGVRSNRTLYSTSIALNGVTAVNPSPTVTDWSVITKFYIGLTAGGSITAVGTINLGITAVGTQISAIPPGWSYARYTKLHLYPTPTAANTYYADVEVHVRDMANGGDEPLLPEDFHWLLVSGALMKEYERNKWHTQYLEEREVFRQGVAELQVAVSRRTFGSHSQPRRFSQLGPFFNAGT